MSGIVVVSATDNAGVPVGVAVRSFMSLSSDPPLVAVALPCTSRTLPSVLVNGVFGISILSTEQIGVARRFASGLPLADRFTAPLSPRHDHGITLTDGCDDRSFAVSTTSANTW